MINYEIDIKRHISILVISLTSSKETEKSSILKVSLSEVTFGNWNEMTAKGITLI